MRVLYLTYNGLTEPLGRRQVLPYVLGLAARGWRFTTVAVATSFACLDLGEGRHVRPWAGFVRQ